MADTYTTVVTVTHGSQWYAELLTQIRQDHDLVTAMWVDAMSSPGELDVPDTHWSVALTEAGATAAWCAATLLHDGTIKCHSNFEVPAHRGTGAYEDAYNARKAVLLRYKRPAVTYLFPEPLGLHLADGWVIDASPGGTGQDKPGPDGPVYHWRRLTWRPPCG